MSERSFLRKTEEIMPRDVTIVEVSPRDGFQAVDAFIPTRQKIAVVETLLGVGFSRLEIGSFVSPKALPQMRDTAEVIEAVRHLGQDRITVLVPNRRGAELALQYGLEHLVFVASVSEAHNRANVGRGLAESFAELERIVADRRGSDGIQRVNLATSFDCPFTGTVPEEDVLRAIERTLEITQNVEICLCDTTGRAFPIHVEELFSLAFQRFAGPETRFAFHAHDTYGFGIANVLAAHRIGVRIFDAAAAGLGGCPFAPGAAGNVASEDVVFTFEGMGIPTGCNLEKLLDAADRVASIEPTSAGGHTRRVKRARALERTDRIQPEAREVRSLQAQ
jgi:hydroxymethylglutaryl-CoA lyase